MEPPGAALSSRAAQSLRTMESDAVGGGEDEDGATASRAVAAISEYGICRSSLRMVWARYVKTGIARHPRFFPAWIAAVSRDWLMMPLWLSTIRCCGLPETATSAA